LLVPVRGVHDFQKLFFSSQLDSFEAAARNLPLLLGYKKSIDPVFLSHVSELTYDLNVYKDLLDRVDEGCLEEPPAVKELVQAAVIAGIERELFDYLDRQYLKLVGIVRNYSETEHEHHGFFFRKQLWNFILAVPIMTRTNLKPRGYSGDSEMMRMIYQDDYQGGSTFGRLLHKHALGQSAAQAVRNRRLTVAGMIDDFVAASPVPASRKIRVLSVACGPAAEVNDILRDKAACDRLHFSLLDQDQQALLEVARLVSAIEKRLRLQVSADFIRESVRTMLVSRQLSARWGRFDFIYSMGLFDYLTPPVAQAVLRKLFDLASPGGEMVIGNFSTENPSRVFMEYWMDWKIILRSPQSMRRLAEGLPGAEVDLVCDQTGIQMLMRIRKAGG